MKVKKGLICGLIVTILCLSFSGCMGEMGISVEKLNYEPEGYINITAEQLEEYPTLKKCVTILNSDNYNKTIKSMDCSKDEINKIEILFGEDPNDNIYKSDNFFKYQNTYYSLCYITAD